MKNFNFTVSILFQKVSLMNDILLIENYNKAPEIEIFLSSFYNSGLSTSTAQFITSSLVNHLKIFTTPTNQ